MTGVDALRDEATRLARAHLPAEHVERWLDLLRPAVHLVTGDDTDEDLPVVGRLGGLPWVPRDFVWPTWEGHGPVPLVADVDLAAVAAAGLDHGLGLPRTGRLLAFYYDGAALQDGDGVVMAEDPPSRAGARVVHVDGGSGWVQAEPPPGTHVYPAVALRGRQALTHPRWDAPALVAAFGEPARDPDDHHHWLRHPVNAEAFDDALDTALRAPGLHRDEVAHQLGGWAQGIQRAPEEEVSDHPLRWRPLLQVGSEPRLDHPPADGADGDPGPEGLEMTWADLGALYWLVGVDDTALADVRFTWQY